MYKPIRLFFIVLVSVLLILSCASCTNDIVITEPNINEERETTGSTEIPKDTETTDRREEILFPEVYRDVILDYENLVSYRLSEKFLEFYEHGNLIPISDSLAIALSETSGVWSNMLAEMTNGGQYLTRESYGYILQDINGDNFPELFWVRADHHVLAIFTVFEKKLYMLDAFWPKYDCFMIESGKVHIVSTGGAECNHYEIRRMEANSSALIFVKEFGTDGRDETNSVIRFEVTESGERIQITEDRLEELLSMYPFYQMGDHWKNTRIHFLNPLQNN